MDGSLSAWLGWGTSLMGICSSVYMLGRLAGKGKQEAICKAQVEKCEGRFSKGNERFEKGETDNKSLRNKVTYIQ